MAEMKVTVGGLKGKMQLTAKGHTDHELTIDYFPPMGEDTGFTPLELVLAGLAGCSAHTIMFLLGKAGKKVDDIHVEAVGQRREEHPTMITHVELRISVKGQGLEKPIVERVIQAAEEKFCPVWAMLKTTVKITWTCEVGVSR
ncbi:MAG TPA: OsmC family protein [Candidatus Latescibacteria bacterium]|nr:OsmC family protein [Candidatus Latescibacterota bacterium]